MNHKNFEPGQDPDHRHDPGASGADGAPAADGAPGASAPAETPVPSGDSVTSGTSVPAEGSGPGEGAEAPGASGTADARRADDEAPRGDETGGARPGSAGADAGSAGPGAAAAGGEEPGDDEAGRPGAVRGDGGAARGDGGAVRAGGTSGAEPGPGPALGDDDLFDEEALRQLLRGAVDDLEPAPHALEHLRRAVPARRTRRRQALVGAAAAVILGGAALPALVHVATTTSASNDRPANAASSERTPGVHGGSHGADGDGKESGKPTEPGEKDKDKGEKDKGDKGKGDKEKDPESPSSDPGPPNPSSTLNATSPICTRAQLGGSTASAGPADANGHVYGSFRVANISTSACTVDGPGAVSATAQGSADDTQIAVVDHTPGDAATQLPDTSTAPTQLILQPGQAFEIRFAWIPASSGGPSGCTTTGATPTPDPTQDGGTGAPPEEQPSSGEPGGEAGGGEGEQPEASVQVNYTPAAGDPVAAATTVPNACAGTIYRTGVLAG